MTDTAISDDWYSEDAATFGDRIVGAREAVSLSQQGLAERLGVKLKTLQAWEEDRNDPRANKLTMLAGVLNVSIRWLLTGEGEGLARPDAQSNPESEGVLEEVRSIRTELVVLTDRLRQIEARMRR